VGMGASGSIALATLAYPTAVRSSGVGWAMGMGRFGQVLAPLFTTAMIAMGWNGEQVFVMFGFAPLVAALAVLALRRTTPCDAATIPAPAE
jgi:MFS transporter, AAHS family, 4-hydroxybenzoate transporter